MDEERQKLLRNLGVACQNIRYKILYLLDAYLFTHRNEDEKGLYINEIADKISAERRLVSFHLTTLEENGLVSSQFAVIEKPTSKAKGKAGRFYKITPDGKLSVNTIFSLLRSEGGSELSNLPEIVEDV